MTSTADAPADRGVGRLARAGLLTGLSDGLFSSVLSVAFYHSTVTRLFQGVAAVPFGPGALRGGTRMAIVGVALHFCVAFGWSAMFAALLGLAPIRRLAAQPAGRLAAAGIYGPLVWMVMSLVVIPLFLQRPPVFNGRWWTQFVGHAPFVGLPIVWTLAGRRADQRSSAFA